MLNKVSGKASAEAHNQYYKSVSEIISAYEEWLENTEPLLEAIITGIENTVKVADACDFSINTGERKLPKFEVKDVEGTFFQEVERGINERLSDKKGDELDTYLERVEKECGVIVPNGLCDYFMILWDIMKWCRDNDINTGPGRGSVCGSLIAYLLYITDVDPLKYDLLFERFLNATRVTPPIVFELELENGEKITIPKEKKLPLIDGGEIDIDVDLDLSSIDIDVDKLKSML